LKWVSVRSKILIRRCILALNTKVGVWPAAEDKKSSTHIQGHQDALEYSLDMCRNHSQKLVIPTLARLRILKTRRACGLVWIQIGTSSKGIQTMHT